MNDYSFSQHLETPGAPDDFSKSSGSPLSEDFTAAPVGEKFVVFFLNGQPFGISAKRIAEVSQPLAIAPVPNAPEWLTGITNLRGDVISVVDLPKLLKTEDLTLSAKSKFIVLQAADSDDLIAFTIEKPGEIIFITSNEIEKVSDESAPYISGKTPYADSVMQFIDVEKLFVSLAFN